MAKDVVADIRNGVSDAELMGKYGLSETGLRNLFKKLLDKKSITPAEFEAWSIFSNDAVPLDIRVYSRYRLKFLLPVFEVHRPENSGTVVSISRHGLGVEGLDVEPDEILTLVIPVDRILGGTAMLLQARCRWVHTIEDRGHNAAGFYVIAVAEGSWDKLIEYAIARSSLEPLY